MAKDLTIVKNIVFICNGNSCLKKGAEENTNILRQTIKDNHIHEHIHTIKTRCCGQCESGPVVFVNPGDVWYQKVDSQISKEIVHQHLLNNQLLKKHIFFQSSPPEKRKTLFFQGRSVVENIKAFFKSKNSTNKP